MVEPLFIADEKQGQEEPQGHEEQVDLAAQIESLIFVSAEPLSVEKMHATLSALKPSLEISEVRAAVKDLLERWTDATRGHGRGLELKKIGGGYVFATAIKNSSIINSLEQKKPLQLSKGQVEVLSIIAYRQPVTRVDVDDIRGVDSSFAIKKLLKLKLLKILGKSEGLGRPLLYGTSKTFLEFFSLNSLNDLPTLKQIESLSEGEGVDDAELGDNIDLRDLFKDAQNEQMFSGDLLRASEDALKSLEDAMLRVDGAEKNVE